MITPIPPLETLLFGLDDEGVLEALEEQAWQALGDTKYTDRGSFILGYRSGLLAALGALRERVVYGG